MDTSPVPIHSRHGAEAGQAPRATASGRVCATAGCGADLSAYSLSPYCALHELAKPAATIVARPSVRPAPSTDWPDFSQDRFAEALAALMRARNLSFRQLAYKTQLSAGYLNHLATGRAPAPRDAQIRTIARALHVEPDHFLEYRLRQVACALRAAPSLTDSLYAMLVQGLAVSGDLLAGYTPARLAAAR